MAQAEPGDELLTLEQVEQLYGVKRSTLYRYIQRGYLSTYRRSMDRRVYVRRSDIEELRRFRRPQSSGGLTLAAVERARAFQFRVFAGRELTTSSAELIEEIRRERSEELP